jgi:hypothetical protein
MTVECEREVARSSDDRAAADPAPIRPRPAGPALPGAVGNTSLPGADPADFVGTWDCLESDTGKKVRAIAFKDDGTFEEFDSTPGFARPGNFRLKNGRLALMESDVILDKFGEDVATRELGQVEWQSRDCFLFTIMDGMHSGPNGRFRTGKILEFWRRAGTAASPRPATAAIAPPRVPSRKVGDLVGLWRCQDTTTNRTIRTVEFRADGSSEIKDISTMRTSNLSYQIDQNILSFPIARGQRRGVGIDEATVRRFPALQFVERGRVTWVDADFFRYEPIDGANVGPYAGLRPGEVLEFHRAVGSAEPGKTGSLVGSWRRFDAPTQPTGEIYEWRLDGTYAIRGDAPSGAGRPAIPDDPNSRSSYQLNAGVLTLSETYAGFGTPVMMRGEVSWVGPDEFVFTVLDGARVANISGKPIHFRRVVD